MAVGYAEEHSGQHERTIHVHQGNAKGDSQPGGNNKGCGGVNGANQQRQGSGLCIS